MKVNFYIEKPSNLVEQLIKKNLEIKYELEKKAKLLVNKLSKLSQKNKRKKIGIFD